ncbi:MAG: PIN domain-containing protein [Candidatus Solibacter sp.]|jgi:predicted nucleic acid-binding protein
MSDLLLDTDAVSILFKPAHPLYGKCFEAASGHRPLISFMTKAELMLWPRRNKWGAARVGLLMNHIGLFTTLYPDEDACAHWAGVVAESYAAGRPMSTADAWIAACARQWGIPLVTANFRDFEHLRGITLAPLG